MAAAPQRPSLAFMLRHPAHWLGLGFGSGLSPVAPGTVGTLWAWAVWVLWQAVGVPLPLLGAMAVVSVPLGWWACTRTASHLGVQDPSCVVWDEIAAFWLLLWAVAAWLAPVPVPFNRGALGWQAAAFVVFRFFDAVKPQPVRWADQVFKGGGWRGGWGIVFDDLVAAACALAVLLAAHAAVG